VVAQLSMNGQVGAPHRLNPPQSRDRPDVPAVRPWRAFSFAVTVIGNHGDQGTGLEGFTL
jgi:hypothetical protein